MKTKKLIYSDDLLEAVVAAAIKEIADADHPLTLRAMSARVRMIESIKKAIAAVPAVEVVEAFTCRECKYWHHSGYCMKLGKEHDRVASDFCSDGERAVR